MIEAQTSNQTQSFRRNRSRDISSQRVDDKTKKPAWVFESPQKKIARVKAATNNHISISNCG